MARGDTRRIIQISGDLTAPKVNEALRQISEAIRKLEGRAGVTLQRSPVNINSDQPTVLEFNPTSGYGPGAIVAYDAPDDQSLWFVRGGVRDEDGVWTATATEFSAVTLEDDGTVSFYYNEQLTIDTQFTPLKTMNFGFTTGGVFCLTMGDATLPSPLNALGSLCWTQPDLWTLGGTTAQNQRLRFWDDDSSHSMILGSTATWLYDFGIFFTGVNPQGFRIGQTTNYTKWDFQNSYFYPNADLAWLCGTATQRWLGVNTFDLDTWGDIEYHDTFWDDMLVPLTSVRVGAVTWQPSWAKFRDDGAGSRGVYAYLFSAANANEAFFEMQMSHRYKVGTDIHPHVHWSSNGTNTGNVKFNIEYSVASINTNFPTTSVVSGTDAGSGVAKDHQVCGLTAISGASLGISHVLQGRVWRDPGDAADTLTDAAWVHYIDFHFEVDSPGSSTEFVK